MRVKAKKHKKNNRKLILLAFVAFSYIVFTAFSKYVLQEEKTHIQNAEEFYFASELLKENGAEYRINDWDINQNYNIEIDLKNHEDALRINYSDIQYEISITNNSQDKVDINLSGDVIKTDEIYTGEIEGQALNEKILTLSVNKKTDSTIDENGINFEVNFKTTSPYEKSLSATFIITPQKENEAEINLIDEVGNEYATLTINNIEEERQYKITYNNQKSVIDTTNEKITQITKGETTSEVTINLEAYEVTKIQFIKKDARQILNLGEDVVAE